MFLGTHEPKLDEKGRLILPARFRDELSEGLVITKGQEHCLYVFTAAEFALITERLRQAPVTQKNSRDYLRVMFAGAHDEVPDNQGRVTMPAGLRTYATLEKNCVVIEDSTNGIAAANAAGIYCIGFKSPHSKNQDYTKASKIITDFSEIS